MPIIIGPPEVSTGADRDICTAWATVSDVCDPCTKTGFDQSLLVRCLEAASEVLFHLSGRQYPGICTETVRPSAQPIRGDHGRPIRSGLPFGGGAGWFSGSWQGATSQWGWCGCGRTERGCHPVSEVALPGYPVTGIVHVKLDGAELVNGVDYRVDDGRFLVRLPDPATGQQRGWPCCSRVDLPDTEAGTWSVTYNYGRMPPPLGVLACAELACQLALALSPQAAGECKLPKRVTSLTRQGMTAVVLDPMAFLDKGKTGLYDVDLFLASSNKAGIQRRATAWHPEMGRRTSRRTGTA